MSQYEDQNNMITIPNWGVIIHVDNHILVMNQNHFCEVQNLDSISSSESKAALTSQLETESLNLRTTLYVQYILQFGQCLCCSHALWTALLRLCDWFFHCRILWCDPFMRLGQGVAGIGFDVVLVVGDRSCVPLSVGIDPPLFF
ncbi:hypothetical protein HELRODRAFT_163952 [Helobdella robusta]|uniref:Uncharacterized protein n=1 Tax=Helobdella robusta TaxID=6412 RepID=T1EUN4_HELRO|nr:hypothetical protein HELRODRAFT_163952 [Helobdella robusta]ESN94166.1 hypothetical protein HELRODRAFT_163952 [Helobdella robusta]